MQREGTLKKVWNIISTALVILIVFCAVFLMGSRLMGYRVFNVISGSMEPTYSVGDLIYVKEVDVDVIEVGTPITFVLNEDLVVATHRVIEIDAENQYFYTKGDANETADSSPVHFNNVIGVPQFSIPLLGYVSDFIQNPPGMYITLGVGTVLIVAVFLPDMIGKKKKEEADEGCQKNAVRLEKDKCVLCGEETDVSTTLSADARSYYIHGVGQLCEACYSKVNAQFKNSK